MFYCRSAAAGWLKSMMPQRPGSLTPVSATHQSPKKGKCRKSECRRHNREAQDHGLSQAGVHVQYIEQTGPVRGPNTGTPYNTTDGLELVTDVRTY